MPVTFMDPRPRIDVVPDVAAPQLATKGAEGAVFGLLANGFPDSAAFLTEVAAAVASRLPAATFRSVEKSRPSDVLTEQQLEVLRSECDAVIAAYGH